MKPSDFKKHPWNSIFQKTEAEVVARNIMVILSWTGDRFRLLSWSEYVEHRRRDGEFSMKEKEYFDKVVGHCISVEKARKFSPKWA